MTPELRDLARRAVAIKGWRWMPGMRWCLPCGTTGRIIGDSPSAHLLAEGWPDLSDPATIGCLLALVRKAWGMTVWVRLWADPQPDMSGRFRGGWEPVDGLGRRLIAGPRAFFDTEAEALVAALEAAGGER